MAGETTDARKRLREQREEVQRQFNTREDEGPGWDGPPIKEAGHELDSQQALDELRRRLGQYTPDRFYGADKTAGQDEWNEDFPEPEWHKAPFPPESDIEPEWGDGEKMCGGCDECEAPKDYDPVAQPEHYTHSRIEVWDAIDAWGLGYRLGNVVKYVSRADRKGNALEDLRKARAYLDREIATRQQDARDW